MADVEIINVNKLIGGFAYYGLEVSGLNEPNQSESKTHEKSQPPTAIMTLRPDMSFLRLTKPRSGASSSFVISNTVPRSTLVCINNIKDIRTDLIILANGRERIANVGVSCRIESDYIQTRVCFPTRHSIPSFSLWRMHCTRVGSVYHSLIR